MDLKRIVLSFTALLIGLNVEAKKDISEPSRQTEILINELQDIISKLETDNPKILNNFTVRDKDAILKHFIDSFDAGVKFSSEKKEDAPQHAVESFKPFTLGKNDILYFRLDNLDKRSIDTFKSELSKYLTNKSKTHGCILDIRNCIGFQMENSAELLSTLRKVKKNHNLPVSVLVGDKTSGSSEIVAKVVDTEKLGITLGVMTAGKPLPQKEVTLESGNKMNVPEVSELLASTEIKPFTPRVKIARNQQVSYEKLYSTMDGEQHDQCLTRAIDVIVSINIMTSNN